MKRILIDLDPLIDQSLQRLAKARGKPRARLIRAALYECVRAAIREERYLPDAPSCGPAIEGSAFRVLHGKLVPVDEHGLIKGIPIANGL